MFVLSSACYTKGDDVSIIFTSCYPGLLLLLYCSKNDSSGYSGAGSKSLLLLTRLLIRKLSISPSLPGGPMSNCCCCVLFDLFFCILLFYFGRRAVGLVPLAMFSMTEILSMFPSDGLTMSIDIVKVKVQPLFLPSDFTSIFPPFYLTKFWQIMSPRPTPSGFKVPVPSKLESLFSLP